MSKELVLGKEMRLFEAEQVNNDEVESCEDRSCRCCDKMEVEQLIEKDLVGQKEGEPREYQSNST